MSHEILIMFWGGSESRTDRPSPVMRGLRSGFWSINLGKRTGPRFPYFLSPLSVQYFWFVSGPSFGSGITDLKFNSIICISLLQSWNFNLQLSKKYFRNELKPTGDWLKNFLVYSTIFFFLISKTFFIRASGSELKYFDHLWNLIFQILFS